MRDFSVATHAELSQEVASHYEALDRAGGALTVTDHTMGEGVKDTAKYDIQTVR